MRSRSRRRHLWLSLVIMITLLGGLAPPALAAPPDAVASPEAQARALGVPGRLQKTLAALVPVVAPTAPPKGISSLNAAVHEERAYLLEWVTDAPYAFALQDSAGSKTALKTVETTARATGGYQHRLEVPLATLTADSRLLALTPDTGEFVSMGMLPPGLARPAPSGIAKTETTTNRTLNSPIGPDGWTIDVAIPNPSTNPYVETVAPPIAIEFGGAHFPVGCYIVSGSGLHYSSDGTNAPESFYISALSEYLPVPTTLIFYGKHLPELDQFSNPVPGPRPRIEVHTTSTSGVIYNHPTYGPVGSSGGITKWNAGSISVTKIDQEDFPFATGSNPYGWGCETPGDSISRLKQDCKAGDPIDLNDGSWYLDVPCLSLGGAGLPINLGLRYSSKEWYQRVLDRSGMYRSMLTQSGGHPGLPEGWTDSYSARAFFITGAYASVIEIYEGGSSPSRYLLQSDGTFASPTGAFDTVTRNATTGVITRTARDGTKSIFGTNGYLTLIEDRLGNQIELTYSLPPNGVSGTRTIRNLRTNQALIQTYTRSTASDAWRLTSIADDPNNGGPVRQVTISYQTDALPYSDLQISSITDAGGRTYTFDYDALGRINTYYDPNNNPAVLGSAAKPTVTTYRQITYTAPTTMTMGTTTHAPSGTISLFHWRVDRQVLANGTTLDLNWQAGAQDNPSNYDMALIYNQGKSDQRIVRYKYKSYEHGIGIGAITRVYNPNSTTAYTSMSFDVHGQLTQVSDPEGRGQWLTYSPQGDLIQTLANNSTVSQQMEYNSYGQLTRFRAPEGEVTRWEYDATTGALEAMHQVGVVNGQTITQTTTFETNAAGQITATRLPDGTWHTQAYDSRGYPTTTTYDANYGGNTNRLALTTTAAFDALGRLTSSTDLRGTTTTVAYGGALGLLGWPSATTVDPAGRAVRTEYSYDTLGNITGVVEDAGTGRTNAAWSYTYDWVGTEGGYAPITVTDPLNAVVAYDYTTYGALAAVRELNPTSTLAERTTSYQYTPEGWLQAVVLHDGRLAVQQQHDKAGLTTVMTDTRGVRTEYTYNQVGQITTRKEGAAAVGASPAINATWTYTHDRNGRLTYLQRPSGGYEVQRSYDGLGRLAWETDGAGNRTTFTYDPARNFLLGIISGDNVTAEELTSSYTYDALGRRSTFVQDPGTGRLNLTTAYAYTAAGSSDHWSLQAVTDPNGGITRFAYDALGSLAATTDALGATWSYANGNRGELLSITPPVGAPTTYTYDALGQQTALSRNGQTETWTYHADGTLAATSDFAGQPTTYGYDATGRLIAIDRVGSDADATYSYSPNDLLVGATSKPDGTTSETTTYGYDAANRLIGRARDGRTVGYTYDTTSRITAMSYWGQGDVTYSYDSYSGRLTSLNPWAAGASNYTYTAPGALKRITRPSGNGIVTDVSLDTAGRLVGLDHTKGSTVLQAIDYVLDANGNRTQLTDTTGTATFAYDALNRLVDASYPALANGPDASSIDYDYDAVGNRMVDGEAADPSAPTAPVTEGLIGSYYTDKNFTTLAFTRTDAQVAFQWAGGSPDPSMPINNFSVAWQGQIIPRYTEVYTFSMQADDGVQLWIDDTLIINSLPYTSAERVATPIALTANQPVNIVVKMVEGSGWANAFLSWQSASQTKELVPQSQLRTSINTWPGGTGLRGTYHTGQAFNTVVLTRTDAQVNFDWGLGSPDPSIPADGFSVRWEGSIVPRYTESYTFSMWVDNGARIWVDGQQILNSWAYTTTERIATPISLEADQHYTITIEMYEGGGGASARLFWQSASQGKSPVLSQYLFPPGTTSGWPYDASDRRLNDGYVYDANGNLLSDGTMTYTYDAANRLRMSSGNGRTLVYEYDALGNLIRQHQTENGSTTTTSFVLDENTAYPRVIGALVSDGSATLYAYGPEGVHAQKQLPAGSGTATVSYALLDGLGSVRAWTSGSTGSLEQGISYDAWGEIRQITGAGPGSGNTSGVAPGYTGEFQRADGTVHLRARVLSPKEGRFLQRDSFAGFTSRAASLNRYAYAEGNPVRYTDPSGHSITWPGGPGGRGPGGGGGGLGSDCQVLQWPTLPDWFGAKQQNKNNQKQNNNSGGGNSGGGNSGGNQQQNPPPPNMSLRERILCTLMPTAAGCPKPASTPSSGSGGSNNTGMPNGPSAVNVPLRDIDFSALPPNSRVHCVNTTKGGNVSLSFTTPASFGGSFTINLGDATSECTITFGERPVNYRGASCQNGSNGIMYCPNPDFFRAYDEGIQPHIPQSIGCREGMAVNGVMWGRNHIRPYNPPIHHPVCQ